jgi:ribonuclease HII
MSQIQHTEVDSLLINKTNILGCDECGYGSLAGSLVVVGVRAPRDWTLDGLNDSKKLSAKKREALLLPLMKLVKNNEISYHLAERSNTYIDKFGVGPVLKEAYVECFKALYQDDCLIIADGTLKFDNLGVESYDKVSVIKADAKYPAVMAASIIAKVWRDDKMHQLHHTYPNYGWLKNVGYGSKDHLEAIAMYGPTPLHRMSYAPMRYTQYDNMNQLKLIP